MKLRGLVPNFHIRVSVSDLYIPTIGLTILLQQNRQTDGGNEAAQFHIWEYLIGIFGTVSLQCTTFVNLSKLWQNKPSCPPVICQWHYLHI